MKRWRIPIASVLLVATPLAGGARSTPISAVSARLPVPVLAPAFAAFTMRIVVMDARTDAPLGWTPGAFANKGGALTPTGVVVPATALAATRQGRCAGRALTALFVSGAVTCTSARSLAVAPDGATGRFRVGDTLYFTASADNSRLLTAPLWALRLTQAR